MRTDKTARNHRAAISLAASLIWIKTALINTPRPGDGASSLHRRYAATEPDLHSQA
jgi:hypothetical protein